MNEEQSSNTNVITHNFLSKWTFVKESLPEKHCLAIQQYESGRQVIIKAFYAKAFEVENPYDDELELDYHEEKDQYFLKEGWYELIENHPEYYCLPISEGVITNWMDLPSTERIN